MLLDILHVSILRRTFTGRRVMKAGEGTSRAGQDFLCCLFEIETW